MLKQFKPITPSLRHLKLLNLSNFFLRIKRLKSKSKNVTRKYGHNNQGRYTSYHKGGGHKRIYRILNQKEYNFSIVEGLEYDPFHSAFLMRLFDPLLSKFAYQIAPNNIKRGDIVRFNINNFKQKLGHTTVLQNIPIGSVIYNISFNAKTNTKLATAAGMYAQVIQKTNKFCLLKLKSGMFRYFPLNSIATLGRASNINHKLINYGKAGRTRWLNKRPTVRGVAMNPIDHPHGGGAGKTSSGRPCSTPWGKLTRGVRTSKKKSIYLFNTK